MKLFKSAIFVAGLIPLMRLFWFGTNDGLGANPIEFITRSTGTWALVFLCITLAMTPLRVFSGSTSWIKVRRMLGLFSFFYACIYFSIWFWLDQDLDISVVRCGQTLLSAPLLLWVFVVCSAYSAGSHLQSVGGSSIGEALGFIT